jgi:hypothetical protein
MKVNINDDVEITLTNCGLEVLREKGPTSFTYNFDSSTNTLKEQLWVVMNVFGGSLWNGGEQLFIKNIIKFKDEGEYVEGELLNCEVGVGDIEFQMLPQVAGNLAMWDTDKINNSQEMVDIVLKSRKYLNLLLDRAIERLEATEKEND